MVALREKKNLRAVKTLLTTHFKEDSPVVMERNRYQMLFNLLESAAAKEVR